ncbi:hypothetical protein FGW37_15635 [Streptomyces rectiverticillatus]|uniref:hypothetical protein n=1 Tax=Streptomyces rectiverticillatus TaxID=173860 RepID=UPI0015C38245|nr:hypothetical protein [Streptomyces rectiverticillatus]QLE72829.1 hypothetical protein FGW37_15635 [Streptomyces rectiverticillatus]
MQNALTQAVRVSAALTYAAAVAACIWALGIDYQPAPHTGVLVCVWTAASAWVQRAVLLWVRRWDGLRREREGEKTVLEKESGRRAARRIQQIRFRPVPDSFSSPALSKARQLSVSALALVASLTALSLHGMPGSDSRQTAIQHAGAEVAVATVVKARLLEKEYDDDNPELVRGYVYELTVTVPGSPAQLATGRTTYHDPVREGGLLTAMWAPDDPSLGAYLGREEKLHRLAAGKWQPNLEGSIVNAIALILGLCLLPWVLLFSLGIAGGSLRKLPWSPVMQSVHAAVAVLAAYGCTPALRGEDPSGTAQALLQAGGWALVGGMIFSPLFSPIYAAVKRR